VGKIAFMLWMMSSLALAQVTNYGSKLPGDPNIRTKMDLDAQRFAPYLDAFNFNPTGAGTTQTTYKVPVNIVYVAIKTSLAGQTNGDYAKVELVDVDNVLGFGAGTVLATPVVKQYVSQDPMNEFDILYPRYVMANLYIRVSYTSANSLSNVRLYVNLVGHKVL
jgi:hypothetical protein